MSRKRTKRSAPADALDEDLQQRLLPPHYGRPPAISRNASSSSSRLPFLFHSSSYTSADNTPNATDTEEAAAVNDIVDRATLANAVGTSSPYGFVLYLLTGIGYVLFLVWAYTPDAWLRRAGVGWYPSREWAILLPAWICMAVVYIYVSFALYAVSIAAPPDSLTTLSDDYARIAGVGRIPSLVDNSHAVLDEETLPGIQDLPVGLVNRAMFGDLGRHESED